MQGNHHIHICPYVASSSVPGKENQVKSKMARQAPLGRALEETSTQSQSRENRKKESFCLFVSMMLFGFIS